MRPVCKRRDKKGVNNSANLAGPLTVNCRRSLYVEISGTPDHHTAHRERDGSPAVSAVLAVPLN